MAAACATGPSWTSAPAEPGESVAVSQVNAGYLTDYARLVPSPTTPGLLMWRNLQTPPARIFIRPVEIWDGGVGSPRKDDCPYVADALVRAVRLMLSENIEIAAAPGPGVHELRLALTRAGTAPRRFQRDRSVLGRRTGPIGHATRDFVRSASLEAELVAPEGGAVVAAVMDRRAVDELPKGQAQSWEDLLHAFSLWGARLRAVFLSAPSV